MSGAARSEQEKVVLTYRITALVLFALLPFSALWKSGTGGDHVQNSLLNALLVVPLTFVLAGVEQLVVAVTARAFGDRVIFVRLNLGPVLLRQQVRRVSVVVHALPSLPDCTIVSPRKAGQRATLGLAILAGAVVVAAPMVAACAGLFDISRPLLAERVAPEVLIAWIGAIYAGYAAYVAIAVMFPNSVGPELARQRRALFWAFEADRYSVRGAFDQAAAAAQRGLEESPEDLILQLTLATARSNSGHPDAFALAKQLHQREIPAQLRPHVLNMWAWQCYMQADTMYGDEAERASREVVELEPDHPSGWDTRGHVLSWLGRHDEAESYLQRSYKNAERESNRGCSAAGLAMIYAATKRPDEAATWLARAREHGCEQRLLARAVAAVDPLHRD